eukprot:TRINITY_DN5063_c0_g1_i1.p1 TRINITY_DN5063_c0_g1~~TRINITY_DN5063_c0_g1_i1.p1  ORF type:complete len:726 (+),score=253.18 TRINITY_DN5063_c0_g1_i1:33-2180(+)
MSRSPLKEINGTTASRIRPPTKIAVEEDRVEMTLDDLEGKENANPNVEPRQVGTKRRVEANKEEELREKLRQRKVQNLSSTITEKSSLKKSTSNDLNSTVAGAKAVASTVKRPVSKTEMNKTITTATKPKTTTTTKASLTTSKGAVASAASSKRPAWDIKGRLEDTEKLLLEFHSKMRANETKVSQLACQLNERETQLTTVVEVKETLQTDVDLSKKELADAYQQKLALQSQMVTLQTEHNEKVQELLFKIKSLEQAHQSTVSQLSMSKAEADSLRLTIESQVGQLAGLQAELQSTKNILGTTQQTSAERAQKIQSLEIEIDQKKLSIAELEAQIREDENLRKKLHNTIQELKGNIRVFCRMRPILPDDGESSSGDLFEFSANNDRTIDINSPVASGVIGKIEGSKKVNFQFDKVFPPTAPQGRVFDEISQLVQSALDGYNTCIFAYGQTGSGKTYTMEGSGYDAELEYSTIDPETRGMIPRSVEQIFETAEKLKEKGWEFEFEANFLEIYNETLRDLLASKVKPDTKYEIKHDSKGVTSVTNMTSVKVRTPSQVYELLRKAAKNRAVARTEMNERSSRSHSVFQLRMVGHNKFSGENNSGTLSLVDLAGSERINASGATGDRLKETQAINKSLHHLGDVIAALANKDSHIPYRNSKLTYLLQNSLGGNSKTLMFVNISPRQADYNETMSSLRFAAKVNACEIGTAKKVTKVEIK